MDTPTLTYTQHTVRGPAFRRTGTFVHVSLDADGGGTGGEMGWTFYVFDLKRHGVQMAVFGDGLDCLFDPRIQHVVAAWRALTDPDAITAADFVRLLEGNGVVPSEYHLQGVRESAPSES
jgi:hypothetical protein